MVNLFELIKGKYIKIGIFSYINEKQKLEMIIYNKKLQNTIDVNMFDYRKISGKYTMFEYNGMGKIFLLKNNELIFKGEYLKGKRNGKGKEYYNEKIIFEGIYLNGKRNGKRKE